MRKAFLSCGSLLKAVACVSLVCLVSCRDDDDYDELEDSSAADPTPPSTGESPDVPMPDMPQSWPRLMDSIRQKGSYHPSPANASECETPEGAWKHWVSLQAAIVQAMGENAVEDSLDGKNRVKLAEQGGEYMVLKAALLQAISDDTKLPLETVKECFDKWRNSHASPTKSQSTPQS